MEKIGQITGRLLRMWPLWLGILLLILFFNLARLFFPWNFDSQPPSLGLTIVYPWLFWQYAGLGFEVFCGLPASIFLVCFGGLLADRGRGMGCILPVVVMIVGAFACFGFYGFGNGHSLIYSELETVHIGDHAYRLTKYARYDNFGGEAVFECDRFGILCHVFEGDVTQLQFSTEYDPSAWTFHNEP